MKAKSGLDIFNSILAVALVVVIVVLALVMGVFKKAALMKQLPLMLILQKMQLLLMNLQKALTAARSSHLLRML